MGQAYWVVNHDRKEFVFNHRFDGGYKYWENICGPMATVVCWLIVNRWRGERIAMIGENSTEFYIGNEIPIVETYNDISKWVVEKFNEDYEENKLVYVG